MFNSDRRVSPRGVVRILRVTKMGMINGTNPLTCDPDYNADETEFIKAMECYKREHRRPFPTCAEVLAVLRSLGYR